MKFWLHLAAERRAQGLVQRLSPYLPTAGQILDIGAGTGHNAAAVQHLLGLDVCQADVVDMHAVGSGPILFDGCKLPFADNTFSAALLAFVLHYPEDPVSLLCEARRVSTGPVLVVQSTYQGKSGLIALRIREFLLGRLAFYMARLVRFISWEPCSLQPVCFYSRAELLRLVRQCGLEVSHLESRPFYGLPLSYDFLVLNNNDH